MLSPDILSNVSVSHDSVIITFSKVKIGMVLCYVLCYQMHFIL